MPNVIVPFEHQAAPNLKYDPGLARAAAERNDAKEAKRRDWDAFDREMDAPGHHDPGLAMLRRAESDPEKWTEENLELWELNCYKARKQHMEGQERWQGEQNERERLVNLMHPHMFIRKLQAAGVDARLAEHRNARVWLNEYCRAGCVGITAWANPTETDDEGYLEHLRWAKTQAQKDFLTENWMAARAGRKVRKTITSLQYPYGPEYSIMRFNSHNVPTKEKYRGWRTALLALIIGGTLTEEECDRAFGPAMGPQAEFYLMQVKRFRAVRYGRRLSL